jgi:hypothetical protein
MTSTMMARGLAVLLLAAALPAGFAAPPDTTPAGSDTWWPLAKRPPFAELPAAERAAPRALLLRTGAFRTDAAPGLEALARRLPQAGRGGAPADGGLLIVQFDPAVAAERRVALLGEHHAIAGPYVPHNALVAAVPPGTAKALAARAEIVWVGRLHPAMKLAPELARRHRSVGLAASEPLRIQATPAPGVTAAAARAAAEAAGAWVVDATSEGLLAEVDHPRTLLALARRDELLFVEPAPELELFNDDSRWVCQSDEPGIDSVHDRGLRGGGQIVAVMDSGLDPGHCCFSGDGKVVDNRAWGGGTKGAACAGDHGHHVAGTVACDNGGDHDGLAPDAGLILQDIGAEDCRSVYPPRPLSSAWDDARARGAYVHTNSWGGGWNSYGSDARAIDDYMWRHQDFLILYAAGNYGPFTGSLGSYSNAKNSLTVGGTRNGTSRDSMYSSSSRGPAGDGRLLPDLLAPASVVYSAKSDLTCGWAGFSGTSMATPAVAGSAALVREYYVRGFYPGGTARATNGFTPSAALVKATMLLSTRNMTGSDTGGARPNADQGFGRLTLDDALWFADEPPSETLLVLDDRDTTTGFTGDGEQHAFTVTTGATAPFKAMLVWTDAPGSTVADQALVNDLDLEVELADGTLYTGNQGFVDGWTSSPSATHDRLNNKEAVFLPSVGPQSVTVRVSAAAINDVAAHAQDYALVVLAAEADDACGPPPAGVGNTARHEKSGSDLLATWADRDADHYLVYRGVTPDFFLDDPAPFRDDVQDADPVRAGIQWRDVGALGTSGNRFYVYASGGACGESVP